MGVASRHVRQRLPDLAGARRRPGIHERGNIAGAARWLPCSPDLRAEALQPRVLRCLDRLLGRFGLEDPAVVDELDMGGDAR